jgi:hypothetical protein
MMQGLVLFDSRAGGEQMQKLALANVFSDDRKVDLVRRAVHRESELRDKGGRGGKKIRKKSPTRKEKEHRKGTDRDGDEPGERQLSFLG